MKPQPLIAVADVVASSRWYQDVLGFASGHGGKEYERLLHGQEMVLQLHRWDVHEHEFLGDPDKALPGNGCVLWFQTNDYELALVRLESCPEIVVEQSHINRNANHRECWLKDPDGYIVVIASQYGDLGDEANSDEK